MNVELEALLKAFDAYMETPGDEAKKVRELEYQCRLDSVLERFLISRAPLWNRQFGSAIGNGLPQKTKSLRPCRQVLECLKDFTALLT